MAATKEELLRTLEDASKRAAQLPDWRRSDDVKRQLEALKEPKTDQGGKPE